MPDGKGFWQTIQTAGLTAALGALAAAAIAAFYGLIRRFFTDKMALEHMRATNDYILQKQQEMMELHERQRAEDRRIQAEEIRQIRNEIGQLRQAVVQSLMQGGSIRAPKGGYPPLGGGRDNNNGDEK